MKYDISRGQESTQTNSWAPWHPRVCFSPVPCSAQELGAWLQGCPQHQRPGLTYADLIIRFSVADAAKFKLVEGVRKLALGRRQVCREGRERGNADVRKGKSPPAARHRWTRNPSQPAPRERDPPRGLTGPPQCQGTPKSTDLLLHPPQGQGSAGSWPAPTPKYTTGDETPKYRENHVGAQAQCCGAVANGAAGRHGPPRDGTSAQAPRPAQRRHHAWAIMQRFIAFQAADSLRDRNPIKFLLAVT